MLIDLHTHSAVSDGTDAPAELVERAARAGLDVVALTDHDTVAGWPDAARAAEAAGIAVVRGMEVSARVGGVTVHVLSYLHDPADPELAAIVEATRTARVTRARKIVDLVACDYDVSWDDIVTHAGPGATIGRPHIADALVRSGAFPDRPAVFESIFAPGGPYHIHHAAPTPRGAVESIRAAGGVPVLAHPAAIKRGRILTDDDIAELASVGLAGLEVHHSDNPPDQVVRLTRLAGELGLFVTGSSDYHGAGKPNRLGLFTTEPAVLAAIEEAGAIEVIRP